MARATLENGAYIEQTAAVGPEYGGIRYRNLVYFQ